MVLGKASLIYDRTERRWQITFRGKDKLQDYFCELEFEAVQILINIAAAQEAE